ncbi:hypothetical protein [Devosia beringensis]|uniref:hypothetical protein n=1 Tax=Devosia beringensis TaxID=2657486 RepID=UPI00186B8363|nr:hypothetical protein [Devosia beringensis]
MAVKKTNQAADAAEAAAKTAAELAEKPAAEAKAAAEAATAKAAGEGRLPENTAVTNPAPGNTMDPASGAFVEPAIIMGVPADHPAVENNPRKATSAVQNGQDFNDPVRDPEDPGFLGQGLDMSVYGKAEQTKK